MSIKALAILFTASAIAATPVSAQQADQNGSPLPQFMSSAGRAQLEQRVQETKPVSQETRQSAEMLSARFAGTLTEPDSDAGDSKPESAAPVILDVPADPAGRARVAVLMATGPSTVPDLKKQKSDRTTLKKPARAPAAAPRIKQTKVKGEPAQAPLAQRSNAYPQAQSFASNVVPGADVGWRTGFLGLFTNPAFWH
jgi:hypothetical protein